MASAVGKSSNRAIPLSTTLRNKRRFRFNTYARWSIMGALRRYLRQDLGVVKPCEGHDTPKYMFLDKLHADRDEEGSEAWQD